MSLDIILDMILKHEGGYVNHPEDPGGETKYGISKRAYPDVEIDKLSESDAKAIYTEDYWNRIKGDDLPLGVACAVMDYAVNSGISRASKALQLACGIDAADGIIGPHTLNAVWVYVKDNSEEELIEQVSHLRQQFLRGLLIYETFGKGWERRVKETKEKALEMCNVEGRQE
jgi:lysozyme family protein